MNIRINYDYYEQILSVYGRVISKKQTTNVFGDLNNSNSFNRYVNIYVSKSICTLKKIIQLALSSNNENLAYASLEVFNHLTLPNDVIPDIKHDYQGYFDDAWIINNFAKYCIEKGYFPEVAFTDILTENIKIDNYLSKDIGKTIYLELHKTLEKITTDFQI